MKDGSMSKNALIVDDSRLACKVLSNMLDSLGIISLAVYSAEEALEYLRHSKPDMIFLDHSMPGMDGLEMIKIIKESPLTATVPVLMYTAKEGDLYVGQARALGAVDVLPKGMEKDRLISSLEQLGFISEEEIPDTNLETKSNEAKKADIVTSILATNTSTTTPDVIPVQRQPDTPTQPEWQSFWQQKVEPFLCNQKSVHSDEIRVNINSQTRQLTKEIHQTLESFEHALAHRLDSHNDFTALQEEIHRNQRKKWLSGFVTVMLVLQFSVIWFLWGTNQSNKQVLTAQSEITQWQNQANEKFAMLHQKVDSIEIDIPAEQALPLIVSLVDEDGTEIAELYPSNNESDDYIGITDTGYQFNIDSHGEINWPFKERYYLTEKCQGETFVNTSKARIYKDKKNQLWYTDKHVEASHVPVNSKLTADNQCISLDNEVIKLVKLQRDTSLETGLDETKSMNVAFTH